MYLQRGTVATNFRAATHTRGTGEMLIFWNPWIPTHGTDICLTNEFYFVFKGAMPRDFDMTIFSLISMSSFLFNCIIVIFNFLENPSTDIKDCWFLAGVDKTCMGSSISAEVIRHALLTLTIDKFYQYQIDAGFNNLKLTTSFSSVIVTSKACFICMVCTGESCSIENNGALLLPMLSKEKPGKN
jgi:hypothetical protein